MLTNPNTLGVFDANIEEIAALVHSVGATLYYDGANLNAVMGKSRPGDMGFDIVHYNLHKSFTQPHGGGGPGSGPIAVSDRIEPFLPKPVITRTDTPDGPLFDLDEDRPQSIGKLRGFQGNYGVFVRSYAYIRSLGAEGLRDASETAVLNANYLLARLRDLCGDDLPLAFGERCMHEFVLSATPLKKETGVQHARPRQAAARPRLPPADGLLPAARRRGAPDRADRDGDEGDARRLRRGARRDRARGQGGPDAGAERPVLDAGPPARRGRGGQAPGHPPGALGAPMLNPVSWTGPFGVWGARGEEIARRLACDDHVEDSDQVLLRAVDVAAPPDVLFRWVCQLRVAPYSYDWLDNRGHRSPRTLTPGVEALEAGQRWMTIFRLVEFEPGRSVTLVHDGPVFGRVAVTYDVAPGPGGGSRLLARLVVRYRRGPRGVLASAVLPAGDLVMMRRQLLTLKACAEGRRA